MNSLSRTTAVIFMTLLLPLGCGALDRCAFGQDNVDHLERAMRPAALSSHVIKVIKLPAWYHEGLYFDGKDMWVANGKGGKIWVIDLKSGKNKGEITPIAGFTESITSLTGAGLFVTDWTEKKVFASKLVGDKLLPVSGISLAPAYPAGLVACGNRLFAITWTRGLSTRFHLVELDSAGKILATWRIRHIQEPAHIAYDGHDMWISSWYHSRIYRVDMETWKVTGYFSSPVSRTTGIAWVGDTIWVTGTHADLYQVAVDTR